MGKIPRQRSGGQTGGFGGHASNRSRSLGRGGTPSRGGGGSGRKPPGGCVVLLAYVLAGIPALTFLGAWVTG